MWDKEVLQIITQVLIIKQLVAKQHTKSKSLKTFSDVLNGLIIDHAAGNLPAWK